MADMTAKLEAGVKAPAFTLKNQHDEKVSLKDLTGQWVVLYFYPKDDTPGCTTEACEFTSNLKQFEKLGATILGVSADDPASHRAFIDKFKLKVTLLSDPDHAVMAKYGAYGSKMMYGKEVVGVIRSTFLIDPKGKIAHAWAKVKAEGHAEKVAAKLADLTK
jgi:peroxiredoxin Q/BCP